MLRYDYETGRLPSISKTSRLFSLGANWMILRVRVSGVRRDDVTDPAERAARSYPEARRYD